MSYQISELKIPKKVEKDYTSTIWPEDRISNLSRLNVFIGPNNSGKSRFLREIFIEEVSSYVPNLPEAVKVINSITAYYQYVNKLTLNDEVTKWLKDSIQKFRIPTFEERGNALIAFDESMNVLGRINNHRNFQIASNQHKNLRSKFNILRNSLKDYQNFKDNSKFKRIYIPALRGLRAPEGDSDFYRVRTISDYFKANNRFKNKVKSTNLIDFEIITGLELYDQVKKHLLGNLGQREKIAEYQNFLGKRYFNGKEVVLIPRENSDVLFVKVGNEEEQPIYKLGDGIQQLIILTIPMFIHSDKKLLMFVEEPELFMHPGFQRLFIETVLEDTEQCDRQVFVATHSTQFLDLTLDEKHISVYKVKKQLPEKSHGKKSILPKFSIENTSNDDFSILEELGIRNSSVMLANCTIWVEGITDRLYLRKYLEIYQNDKKTEYLEDIHYSFVEYGGANLIHWSFLDENDEKIFALRISNRIFLIQDRDSGKITSNHETIEEALGINYHRLTSREIENLLAPELIKEIIREYEGEDVQIAEFKKTDYSGEYLGDFIEKTVLNGNASKKYAAKSGTISDKLAFAKKAIRHMKSKDDLSKEAWNLTEKLLLFIKKNNE